MNEQLQQAISELFSKFGIVFDEGVNWTSETLMPYIQELIHRMQIYKIVTSSIGLFFTVSVCIFCVIFFKKMYSANKLVERTRKENFFFDEFGSLNFIPEAISATCSALAFVLFILGIVWIDTIISWLITPDIEFIKYLVKMLATFGGT